MIASLMTAPSRLMRSASHNGTRPPCSGRSALPALWAMRRPVDPHALRSESASPRRRPDSAPIASAERIVDGVAGAAHGANWIPLLALRQPLAQASDMHIDRAFVDLRRSTPDKVEQLPAREHPARLLEQIFEQPKIRRPQADVAIAAADAPGQPIQIEVSGAEPFGDPFRPAAPEQGAHASQDRKSTR